MEVLERGEIPEEEAFAPTTGEGTASARGRRRSRTADDDRLPITIDRDEPEPEPGVQGVVAVVAHHEQLALGDLRLGEGPSAALGRYGSEILTSFT